MKTTDEEGIKSTFQAIIRRQNEIRLLRILSLTKKSHSVGETVFNAAADYALGSYDATFPQMAGEAAKNLDAGFFETSAIAIRAVTDGKKSKPNKSNAHIIAALQSKLYLEQKHGQLPTKKEVRQYAIKVFIKWFGHFDMKPYKDTVAGWKDIFTKAKINYLPNGVRGDAVRR